jgi:hypothetical protein
MRASALRTCLRCDRARRRVRRCGFSVDKLSTGKLSVDKLSTGKLSTAGLSTAGLSTAGLSVSEPGLGALDNARHTRSRPEERVVQRIRGHAAERSET